MEHGNRVTKASLVLFGLLVSPIAGAFVPEISQMTCGFAQYYAKHNPVTIMRDQGRTVRFVTGQDDCFPDQDMVPIDYPTLDNASCSVGYVCINKDTF